MGHGLTALANSQSCWAWLGRRAHLLDCLCHSLVQTSEIFWCIQHKFLHFTCMMRCGCNRQLRLSRLLQHLTQLLRILSTFDLQQSSDELFVSSTGPFHLFPCKEKLMSLLSLSFLALVNVLGHNDLQLEVGRKRLPLLAARAGELFQVDIWHLLVVLSLCQSVLTHQLKKCGTLLFIKGTHLTPCVCCNWQL